jgi:drug/metabolite transporter (DMT)-like permease
MASCFATASMCFIMALARTSVANTLVIQSLSPFSSALW